MKITRDTRPKHGSDPFALDFAVLSWGLAFDGKVTYNFIIHPRIVLKPSLCVPTLASVFGVVPHFRASDYVEL